MKLKSFRYFNEAKQVGTLYHYTNLYKLISILKTNILRARTSDDSLDNKIYANTPYISLTRNKNFHLQTTAEDTNLYPECRIQLDGDELTNSYKVFPYNYNPGDVGDEYEERLYHKKGIINIKKHIKKIDIYLSLIDSKMLDHVSWFQQLSVELGISNLTILDVISYIQTLAPTILIFIDNMDVNKYINKHYNYINASAKNQIYR